MSSNIDFLFVRHGESYANISPIYKLKQKFLHEPFLTNNGLLQAYLFGTKLKETYSDYDEIIFCSSLMVRSMQTCKLISKGYCDHNKIRLSKEIKRLPFCMEKSSLFDKLYIPLDNNGSPGTQNVTSIKKSNDLCNYLNKNKNSGLKISNKIFCEELIRDKCDNYGLLRVEDMNRQWEDFKTHIIPKLTEKISKTKKVLILVVSHGLFIKEALLNNKSFLKNLDSIFINLSNINELKNIKSESILSLPFSNIKANYYI